MIFSLLILLLISPALGLPSFFRPARERISVRGTLMCGDNTAENYRMELFEEDPFWNDLLISTESDENGRFGINAVDEELGGIEAFLLIHNRCNEEKNCVRLRKISIPSNMINRVFVLNNINLNPTITGEARICDKANAWPDVYVRNFGASNEEVESVVPKQEALEASIEKPSSFKETLEPKNTTPDSIIRTLAPEINGLKKRKFSIEDPEETRKFFISTSESTTNTTVLSIGKAELITETGELKSEAPEPTNVTVEAITDIVELKTARPKPSFEKADSTFETAEPTDGTPELATKAGELRTETPEPTSERAEPTTYISEPTTVNEELQLEEQEPTFGKAESSIATPEPTLYTPKLTSENPEPTTETEELKIETTESPVDREGLRNDTSNSNFEIAGKSKPKTKTPLVEVPHVLIRFDLP